MRVRWRCDRCGRSGTCRLEVRQVWHECYPPRRRRRRLFRMPPVEMSKEEYLSEVFGAFEEAVGEEEMLRRVE